MLKKQENQQSQSNKGLIIRNLFGPLKTENNIPPQEKPLFTPSLTERTHNRTATEVTPEKRVRLRDYLFIASTSVTRNNNERKKNRNTPKAQNQASNSNLRKQKYEITNTQIYGIVKKEIQREYKAIINEVQSKLDLLNEDDENQKQIENQDLVDLYNIKRIITDRVKPAIKEINQALYRRESKVAKQVFFFGKNFLNNIVPQESNQKNSPVVERSTGNINSLLSTFNMHKTEV